MDVTKELTFRHLYDHYWGVIQKPLYRWQNSTIIFPEGFQPLTGKKYRCQVTSTMGTFKYEGKNYDLAIATLVDRASILDEIDYVYRGDSKLESPLAAALSGLQTIALPEQHELFTVKVVKNHKKPGSLMFKPIYKDNDPYVDGQTSMNFFHLSDGMDKLYEGQTWQVRVISRKNTHNINAKGAIYVNIEVELLEEVKTRHNFC